MCIDLHYYTEMTLSSNSRIDWTYLRLQLPQNSTTPAIAEFRDAVRDYVGAMNIHQLALVACMCDISVLIVAMISFPRISSLIFLSTMICTSHVVSCSASIPATSVTH